MMMMMMMMMMMIMMTIFVKFEISCGSRYEYVVLGLLYLQVYPTTIRSLGVGVCNGMARFGGVITPFVAQVSQ